MHEEYLIEQGQLKRRGDKRIRAGKLALAVCKVWNDLGVPHNKIGAVTDKVQKLLTKHRKVKNKGNTSVPKGEQLFDIAACKCFRDISPSRCKSLDPCTCAENPWDEVTFPFYINQRDPHDLRAWFVKCACDTEREDAAEAEAEDAAIDRAREEDRDNGVRFAIQIEELEYAADINPDAEADFWSSIDHQGGISDDEEEVEQEVADEGGEEETAKQREADKDWAPSESTQRCSTCGPQRCTTKLEASSALASRYGLKHNAAAAFCNAFLEDMHMFSPTTAMDPAKFIRKRKKHGDNRTRERLAGAKRMRAIFFDERIDDTKIKETVTTTVETSKKGRGESSASESTQFETVVQRICSQS